MTSPAKFVMRISVNLRLVRDGHILLLRRFKTGWKDGMYGVVAGHVDGNETLVEAMIREAHEEAGIEITAEDLVVIHAQHRIPIPGGIEYIDFHLSTKKWKGEPINLEPDKCDELSWHPLENLPSTLIPYMRSAFDNIEKGVAFSEWRETL